VLGSGDCWAGLYIVMSFVKGEPLSRILQDPSEKDRPILNPNISDRALKRVCREMASLVIELSKVEFPRIGELEQNDDYCCKKTFHPQYERAGDMCESASGGISLAHLQVGRGLF